MLPFCHLKSSTETPITWCCINAATNCTVACAKSLRSTWRKWPAISQIVPAFGAGGGNIRGRSASADSGGSVLKNSEEGLRRAYDMYAHGKRYIDVHGLPSF